MNRAHPFNTNSLFKPAIQILSGSTTSLSSAPAKQHRPSTSIDESDIGIEGLHPQQATPERHLMPSSTIQLKDLGKSRSPSPYTPRSSLPVSEDDDSEYEPAASLRPLVKEHGSAGVRGWRRIIQGGIGDFLTRTWAGWQILVAVLAIWSSGTGFGVLLLNRFILWTGVYKFPYPVTVTFLQLFITHLLLLGFSNFTRVLARPLQKGGLDSVIAPALPPSSGPYGFRSSPRSRAPLLRWLRSGRGGIAGGGVLEFDRAAAKQALPLALIFMTKVLLSNISFASAVLPLYSLARIGTIPLTLLLTTALTKTSHSMQTLSATIISTLNLLFASISPRARVTWEPIVAGIFSSLFSAAYPILLQRTHQALTSQLLPRGGSSLDDPFTADDSGKSAEASSRAYYQTLHYTSLLSLAILFPILLLSRELPSIFHHCPFLDVPWFWFLIVMSSLLSFGFFVTSLLYVNTTSPLTANFTMVPRSAFQLAVIQKRELKAGNWIGVALCWVCSLWYLATRRLEGRERGKSFLRMVD